MIRARFVEMFGDPVLNEKGWKIVTVGDIVTEVRYGTANLLLKVENNPSFKNGTI